MKLNPIKTIGRLVGVVKDSATGEAVSGRKKRLSIAGVAVALLVDVGLDVGIAEALVDLVLAAVATQ